MSQRIQKVNELIRHEISEFLQENLPVHAGILTITAVETSPDLRNTKVWFSYIGHDLGSVTEDIRKHQSGAQKYLNHKLSLKYVPRLSFQFDQSGEYAEKISKVIDEAL